MTKTVHVSTSFAVPREIRELGESYPALVAIDRAYLSLIALCEAAEAGCAGEAKRVAYDFRQALGDARHDAEFGGTLALAKDAFNEAGVVRVVK